jgi:hypothetical protein
MTGTITGSNTYKRAVTQHVVEITADNVPWQKENEMIPENRFEKVGIRHESPLNYPRIPQACKVIIKPVSIYQRINNRTILSFVAHQLFYTP